MMRWLMCSFIACVSACGTESKPPAQADGAVVIVPAHRVMTSVKPLPDAGPLGYDAPVLSGLPCPSGTSLVRPLSCYSATTVCRDSAGALCAVCSAISDRCVVDQARIVLYGCPGPVVCYARPEFCQISHPLCE